MTQNGILEWNDFNVKSMSALYWDEKQYGNWRPKKIVNTYELDFGQLCCLPFSPPVTHFEEKQNSIIAVFVSVTYR